jgi:hypothetical protein
MAGIAGDSGIGVTAYLFVDAASQARLTRSEQDYLAAVSSRQVFRAVRRATITDGTTCVAVNLGLDNRGLLPPFIPVQRNSDGLFASELRACFHDACLGHFPFAILHDPEQTRRQNLSNYWERKRQLRTPELLAHLMSGRAMPQHAINAAAALRDFGANLLDIGSMADADFQETLRRQVWSASGVDPESSAAPQIPPAVAPFYRRYREQHFQLLRESITQERYLAPWDLQALGAPEEVQRLTRELVRRFGELLAAWPEIHAAALRLRARGVELAPRLEED